MSDIKATSANPISANKPIKRKQKDKLKRPLSAYNHFSKEEREKISKAVCCDEAYRQKQIDPYLTPELIKKLKTGNGKVSFEEIGKLIGLRWKDVNSDPERAFYYTSLAEADTERYKKDMKARSEMENHERNEVWWSLDARHDVHVNGCQIPSSFVQHELEMTMPSSDTHIVHAGYSPGHHMEPNVSQAQCSGQTPMGSYYDLRRVTGAQTGHENQDQSNAPSHSYDDYSVTNSEGSILLLID